VREESVVGLKGVDMRPSWVSETEGNIARMGA
jgi:hypothetical protein